MKKMSKNFTAKIENGVFGKMFFSVNTVFATFSMHRYCSLRIRFLLTKKVIPKKITI